MMKDAETSKALRSLHGYHEHPCVPLRPGTSSTVSRPSGPVATYPRPHPSTLFRGFGDEKRVTTDPGSRERHDEHRLPKTGVTLDDRDTDRPDTKKSTYLHESRIHERPNVSHSGTFPTLLWVRGRKNHETHKVSGPGNVWTGTRFTGGGVMGSKRLSTY